MSTPGFLPITPGQLPLTPDELGPNCQMACKYGNKKVCQMCKDAGYKTKHEYMYVYALVGLAVVAIVIMLAARQRKQ